MAATKNSNGAEHDTQSEIQNIKDELAPFVVAVAKTRMPILFADAKSAQNEIVYANQSFLNRTGYDRSEVTGLPFHCLLAKAIDRAHTTLDFIANTNASTLDLCCLRKDGTEFDAAIFVSPVLDATGELQQYFISVFDLSEHIEGGVRRRLREAEIYRHAPGFIAFTEGPDHRFTFTNTAYEVLVGRRDLVGRKVADVFPELAGQGFIELLSKVYKSGERAVGKNAAIRLMRGPKDEEEIRFIDFVYEPVRDAAGAVHGLFCEGSDITDARAVSEKLEEIQAQLIHVSRTNAMSTMAATLAHEINQPLAAISNFASGCIHILEKDGIHSEKLDEGLSAIVAASDRAGKIISRLRDMTKRTTPAREIFDLSDALGEAVNLVRSGGCDDASISTQLAPSLAVRGDKIQIQQVLINLLRNACYAAAQNPKAGSVIALSVQKNSRPSVVIRDNGSGLPATIRNDPFQWTESTKPDGMGIGLSVCRTIAEAHGGEITVDETGPTGTSFTFSLPALVAPRSTAL